MITTESESHCYATL